MNINERIHSDEAYEFYINAQVIERRDDRWIVANRFFQEADYQRHLIGRSDSAILASDWVAFGYKEHTLEEYLQRELELKKAYAARAWH